MKKVLVVLISIICIFSLCSCSQNEYLSDTPVPNISPSSNMLLIDLKGAVMMPNVYKVKEGIILYELIALAGGFTSNADVNNVNLVMILTENQMIIIPEKRHSSANQESDLVNINTATIQELTSLPGIGTAKATTIITYRESNGYFITIDDLKKVSGIGEELFSKIKSFICV